ncbi:MAG: patatin-like phospholipase family protein [Steroidobacteraceae bacterium]
MRPLLVFFAAVLAGCTAAPTRLDPLPQDYAEDARVPGIPGARYWGDERPPGFDSWEKLDRAQLAANYGGIMDRPHAYLALSGGGSDGAFGAGLLVGWTEHGNRPEFTIVTGVSTGALIAPFAFLGPKYDATLKRLYTETSTRDIVERRSLLDIVRNDSAASSAPLRTLLERYVDDAVIAELAAESARGRSLLIGTTDLDTARPVTWNITRIAASGLPSAKKLIHDILLASASIPGIFPPVMLDVEARGRIYQEMHVDGGVTAQVFIYPSGLDWRTVERKLGIEGRADVYVINNSRDLLPWETVPRRVVPILMRSVDSLIRTQGIGDLAQIYLLTQRDGLNFHLAYIPSSFTAEPTEKFDPVYMRKLFQLGYERARAGYPWTLGPERN